MAIIPATIAARTTKMVAKLKSGTLVAIDEMLGGAAVPA